MRRACVMSRTDTPTKSIFVLNRILLMLPFFQLANLNYLWLLHNYKTMIYFN